MRKPVVGVMGASVNDGLSLVESNRLQQLAESLGAAIAQAGCFLVTGATTGLPALVATAFRKQGGLCLGNFPGGESRRACAALWFT